MKPRNQVTATLRPGSWINRLMTAGLFTGALASFFLAAIVFVRGRPWAHLIYAENPYAHAAAGLVFLALWQAIRTGFAEPATVWRARLGKTLLATFSLGFSFMAGEIALRGFLMSRQQGNSLDDLKQLEHKREQIARSSHPLAVIIQPSAHASIVYELQPNLDMVFGGRSLKTNRAGFRESRDYPTDRAPGTFRIVGLGDSGMFGWSVDQDGDYLSVLERELGRRNDGFTYEVVNMAVPGYNTELEAETLRHKGLAYQPDLVIVGWCENDGHLPFFLLEKEDFTRRDVSFLNMLLCRREDFRMVASGTTIKDLRSVDEKKISPEMLSGTEEQGLRKAFSEIRAMRDEHGFRLLVFGPLGKGIRDLLSELGIEYYNTREKVDKTQYPEDWAVHFMHPSPEGHRVLGEHLAEHLEHNGHLLIASE